MGQHVGTVQLCYNNVLGTVCDDSWDDNDAAVVCQQLGYPGELSRSLKCTESLLFTSLIWQTSPYKLVLYKGLVCSPYGNT